MSEKKSPFDALLEMTRGLDPLRNLRGLDPLRNLRGLDPLRNLRRPQDTGQKSAPLYFGQRAAADLQEPEVTESTHATRDARDADDVDNEAAERLREASDEAEDDLREVILNIIRAYRNGGTIVPADVGELSEVASAYFDDDVFEREYCGEDDGT